MKICGIKLTHDGSIALIDDGKLIFSYEMEKLDNKPRFSEWRDLDLLPQILERYGYTVEDIDHFVFDGWREIEAASARNFIAEFTWKGAVRKLALAPYGHLVIKQDLFQHYPSATEDQALSCSGFMHVAGHVASAYCTSPFAARNESSFVLIWDGGMSPQLFYFNADTGQSENLRPLFMLNGSAYALFAQHFPPFVSSRKFDMSVAGKVMAYIALGQVSRALISEWEEIFRNEGQNRSLDTHEILKHFVAKGNDAGYSPEDMMASFHVFLQELLLNTLSERLSNFPDKEKNLCYAGGCALNIKWNSALRNSGMFNAIWIPPFPNDSGSAIGAACCEMMRLENRRKLNWSVYAGPPVVPAELDSSWEQTEMEIEGLADIIAGTQEAVVVLTGAAEIGPRALGNRSILAHPGHPQSKLLLNQIKRRAEYRPVAPICLEEDAPQIFAPGTPDPYMLFDHQVRPDWLERIPAVVHLDGTARLQTVSRDQNQEIYRLLTAFKALTGIPLLCNTSANFNGSGFFPDITSVARWGGVNFIWNAGTLHYRKGFDLFVRQSSESEEGNDKNSDNVILEF